MEDADRPDDRSWVNDIGAIIVRTMERVVPDAPDGTPRELWSTALQLATAAFASSSTGRSKVEVRHGIDHLNAALNAIIHSELCRDPMFTRDPASHLALVA